MEEKVTKKKKYFLADNEKIQKKLEELGTGVFFKPKEGKSIVRILPPWSADGLWYKEAVLHYGMTNEDGKERGYACLKMFEKKCPFCRKYEELSKGSPEDRKIAERIKPRIKFYTNILELRSGKVMIWGFSQKTLGILLSYCSDPDYGDISHPENGFDIVIERTGTSRTDTRYSIRCRPKPSEISVEGWEENMHDLDSEVAEEMEVDDALDIVLLNFGGRKEKDIDDEEEEEESEGRTRTGKAKKEEEEVPVRKAKPGEVEEEESEDEDDEDEEDGDED